MRTLSKEAIIEFEEKKSKFIGYIKPVTTVKEAEHFINFIKDTHTSATHSVPLYRVVDKGQEHLKYNDDGEPSGTAGKPMADIAIIQDIYNFAMVAVRYFGGVKLGAGGLIRMYAKTAKLAIQEACPKEPDTFLLFKYVFDYSMTSKVNETLSKYSAEVISEIYTDTVEIIFKADKSYREELLTIYNISASQIIPE